MDERTSVGPVWTTLQDESPYEPRPGIGLRFIHGEKLMLSHVTLQPGAVMPPHAHPNEQAGLVMEGVLRMTIGDETRDLTPGDAYPVPGGVAHGATAPDGLCVVLDVFSPPREDYVTRR